MTDQPNTPPPGYGGPPMPPGYGQPPAPPGYGQPPAPGWYGQPPGGYGGPPQVQSTNTMAILSLVFAFVFAPLGIIFGFMARSQIKRTGEQGSGLALAGIIVSAIQVGIFVLVIASIALFALTSSDYGSYALAGLAG